MDGAEGPVTLVARHRVRPGREAAFEAWLRGIAQAAVGGRGYHVVRPTPGRPEYTVLLRFDTLADLESWDGSAERREWLAKLAPLVERPPALERHTGLEVWFTPPAGRRVPPRWRMAVVTAATLYPLVTAVQAVGPFPGWPLPVRTLATTCGIVAVMTYAAMPLTTRLFGRWLYGRGDEG
jgi:antibiotic biosynthesis monooxygenase (ABM) superfamily enzyme